ncbi:MAG: metallophosphoesterase family protein [Planctomycetes bacterium]|nr:metallophosphoesterase family protein [Planctomycetota bacterium]
MKYGILGDIHANLEALQVVFDEMEKQGVQKYISVGDVIGYGANPQECVELLKKKNTSIVAGNHDLAIAGRLDLAYFNTYAKAACLWTRQNMDKKLVEELGRLPMKITVDDFTVVHATLYNPEQFDYIQTSYDAHLSFLCQATKLCFIGHSHIPIVFYKNKTVTSDFSTKIERIRAEKILVNVGAIGQPRDENPDAVCTVYDSDTGLITIKRLKYQVEITCQKIIKAGLPSVLSERLKYGR